MSVEVHTGTRNEWLLVMKPVIYLQLLHRSDHTHRSGSPPTENRGNGPQKNPCQGKHWEFGNFAKTLGISFAQVVNSLILRYRILR